MRRWGMHNKAINIKKAQFDFMLTLNISLTGLIKKNRVNEKKGHSPALFYPCKTDSIRTSL